ncbi:MAG: formylglycine-generating enzyme family protein [Proteobacteria bacterium]|nr:formylglycine-generating enzyme family protein [Pseudomonadota bacterium]
MTVEFSERQALLIITLCSAIGGLLLLGIFLIATAGERVEEPPAEGSAPRTDRGSADVDGPRPLAGQDLIDVPSQTTSLGCWEEVDEVCLPERWPMRRIPIQAFALAARETTVGEFRRCVDAGDCLPPATHEGCTWELGDPRLPVNCVDWDGANRYCLTQGLDLPTEDQWEVAARSGRPLPYAGADAARLDRFAWSLEAADGRAHRVADLTSSAGGFYDLSGNVAEWTRSRDPDDPRRWITRGGSFDSPPRELLVSWPEPRDGSTREPDLGFRCVRNSG